MANIIRIKRRSSAGATGAPSSLASSELAHNEADNIIYIGFGDDGNGAATSIKAIAGEGAYTTLTTSQTISGAKTFSTAPVMTDTLSLSDSSTKLATTAYVKGQNYLTGNQSITVSGDATGSGTTAITLTLANSGVGAGTYTKVTVNAKGLVTSATTLSATDIPTLTASKISDFDTQVRTSRLDQMAAPTAAVSLNNQRITNLAEPVDGTDAATKSYVDGAVQGLDVKESVRAASSSDVTLSSPGSSIGGVSVTTGDRVLLFGQSDATQNGIYVFNGAAATMTRATDADTAADMNAGTFVFVEEGTFADNGYVLTTNDPITLGSTNLVWSQFSGAGQITAGQGLAKSGNELSVNVDNTTLEIVSDTLQIKSTYAGQTSLTTLGTVTTGTWNGTIIGLGYGGTGADLSLSAVGTIFKRGATGFTAASEGTDYLSANSTVNGGTF